MAPATSLNISAQSIAVADFNADGNPDVALGLAGASLVTSVLLGNGDGTFQSAASFPDGAGAPVLVGDFNRDKAPDIVINNGSAVTMLLNTGGTRITLTSSANPSPQGQPVTFTANVSVSVAVSGKAKPSGSITFMDGAASLGTVPLNAGQASFTTSSLSKGTHSITALYSGDSNYNQRRSAGLKETIN